MGYDPKFIRTKQFDPKPNKPNSCFQNWWLKQFEPKFKIQRHNVPNFVINLCIKNTYIKIFKVIYTL